MILQSHLARLPHRAAGAPVVALLPSDNVIVRELRDEDVWPMASLLRNTFAAESNPASGIAIIAEHILGIRKRRSTNLILVAAAEETGELVGSVECFTSSFLASQLGNDYPDRIRLRMRPYLASLAVRSDARRCGVASSLVRAVEDRVLRGPPPHILTLEVGMRRLDISLYLLCISPVSPLYLLYPGRGRRRACDRAVPKARVHLRSPRGGAPACGRHALRQEREGE